MMQFVATKHPTTDWTIINFGDRRDKTRLARVNVGKWVGARDEKKAGVKKHTGRAVPVGRTIRLVRGKVSIANRHRPRQWTFEEMYVWSAQCRTKERSKCLHVARRDPSLQIPGCAPNGSWRESHQPRVSEASSSDERTRFGARWPKKVSPLQTKSVYSTVLQPSRRTSWIISLGQTRQSSNNVISISLTHWQFFRTSLWTNRKYKDNRRLLLTWIKLIVRLIPVASFFRN